MIRALQYQWLIIHSIIKWHHLACKILLNDKLIFLFVNMTSLTQVNMNEALKYCLDFVYRYTNLSVKYWTLKHFFGLMWKDFFKYVWTTMNKKNLKHTIGTFKMCLEFFLLPDSKISKGERRLSIRLFSFEVLYFIALLFIILIFFYLKGCASKLLP